MTIYEMRTLQASEITAWATVAATIGTFSVIIWAIYKETILQFLKRPIFEKIFKMEQPYITCAPFDSGALKSNAYCYHLEIENKGKTTAKECTASLVEIYQNKNGQYRKIDNYIPMVLKWVRESNSPTSISPGQKKYLDIGYIQEGDKTHQGKHVFHFFFNGFSDFSQFAEGSYRLKIVVYSENTKNFPVWLDMQWTGTWQRDFEDMKKELTMKPSPSVDGKDVAVPRKKSGKDLLMQACSIGAIIFAFLGSFIALAHYSVISNGWENVLPGWKKINDTIQALTPTKNLPEKIILNQDAGYWEAVNIIDKHFIDVLRKDKIRGITQRRDMYPSQGQPIVAQNWIFLDLDGKTYVPVTPYKAFFEKLKADRAILFISFATMLLLISTILSSIPNFLKKK